MGKRTPSPQTPRSSSNGHQPSGEAPFTPVATRPRHDGWTAARQEAFLVALAETACVDEACRHVGLSRASAYALRRRADAQAFRLAWDSALDYAVAQLADAALSRALHGVARPVFYKGEQVGERRYFDERLTMFLLRHRSPVTYGDANRRFTYDQHPDGPALILNRRLNQAGDEAHGREFLDEERHARRAASLHTPRPSTDDA